jgi:hypothetical protein
MRKYTRDPEHQQQAKERSLRRYYGLSVEDYRALLASQDNCCAACGVSFDDARAHIDHDHACCPTPRACGECVRGILCSGCNRALGFVNDDPEKLIGLYDYLKSWELRSPMIPATG